MSSPQRPEFDILDTNGVNYHSWVSDMEIAFASKGFLPILSDNGAAIPYGDHARAQAVMFMRRHIDRTLKKQYLDIKDPKVLWDKLKNRFANVKDSQLPELTLKWETIKFSEFETVNKFQQEIISLQSDLLALGIKKEDKDLIEKTFSTFPPAYNIMCNHLKLMVKEKSIKDFNELMVLLSTQERADELRLNNSRRPGSKPYPTPQANYGKVKKPKGQQQQQYVPYNKGQGYGNHARRRSNQWRRDAPPQQAAPQYVAPPRDAPPRGGRPNRGRRNGPPPPPSNPPKNRPRKRYNGPPPPQEFAPCYHCGSVKHFHRDCHASNKTRDAYKTYQRFLKEESNYAENEVIEANACHVDPPKAQPQTLDAPDFD
jgi:hypothetical protein